MVGHDVKKPFLNGGTLYSHDFLVLLSRTSGATGARNGEKSSLIVLFGRNNLVLLVPGKSKRSTGRPLARASAQAQSGEGISH